jgi:hypothetical protein
MHRISIRNNTFNTGSDEFETQLEIIIVNAAPVQRIYYANEFDPNAMQAPVCWSSDTRQPDSQVFEKQAVRCMDCKHDIRGSASGGGRACKYSQKLAVLLKDDPNVYQLHIPANSIFGRAKDGHMPLQEYARFLQQHSTPSMTVFTKMYFDGSSAVPKLFFAPLRPLEETELELSQSMVEHPDTLAAITLDFSRLEETNSSPFEETEGFTLNA